MRIRLHDIKQTKLDRCVNWYVFVTLERLLSLFHFILKNTLERAQVESILCSLGGIFLLASPPKAFLFLEKITTTSHTF